MTRIGIIGLGFMGRVHYDTYSKVSGAEVVAVCDADPKRAAGDLSDTWGNVDKGSTRQLPMDRIKGTTDWRELITLPQVDVIDICVPTPLRKTKDPDLSYIVMAVDSVAAVPHRGKLVILESTTYPGTTDEVVQPKLEAGGL